MVYNEAMKIFSYAFRIRFVAALSILPFLLGLVIVGRSLISWNMEDVVVSLMFGILGALPLIPAHFLYRGKAWARIFFIIAALLGAIMGLLSFIDGMRERFFIIDFPGHILSIMYNVANINLFPRLGGNSAYEVIISASIIAINMLVIACLINWKSMRSRFDGTYQPAAHIKHMRLARLGAYIIDHLFGGLVLILSLMFMGREAFGTGTFFIRISIAIIVICGVEIIFIICRSQTIGKYFMNLRVVDANTGARISAIRYIFLREFIGSWLVGLGAIPGFNLYRIVDSAFIFSKDERTIHDLIAGTKVVRC